MASQTPPNDPKKEGGWIERLAQRSTGLGEPKPASESQNRSNIKDLSRTWQYAGLGLQFAGTVAIFWFIGRALDRYMKWDRAGTLVCIMIAVIGSTYNLIKVAMKANKDSDKK